MDHKQMYLVSSGVMAIALIISVLALGFLGPTGFGRFSTKEFWSIYGGCLGTGLILSVFVGIMSAGAPNIQNPGQITALVASTLFLSAAFVGLFPSYFLMVPVSMLARIAVGIFAFPVFFAMVLPGIFQVLEFFQKK